MFAIEEDLDKKLWLYAIHLGKDRSEVINDLLRPIVASMVLYDSRDRRGSRSVEQVTERGTETRVTVKVNLVSHRDLSDGIAELDPLALTSKMVTYFASSASGKSNRWPHVTLVLVQPCLKHR